MYHHVVCALGVANVSNFFSWLLLVSTGGAAIWLKQKKVPSSQR